MVVSNIIYIICEDFLPEKMINENCQIHLTMTLYII